MRWRLAAQYPIFWRSLTTGERSAPKLGQAERGCQGRLVQLSPSKSGGKPRGNICASLRDWQTSRLLGLHNQRARGGEPHRLPMVVFEFVENC